MSLTVDLASGDLPPILTEDDMERIPARLYVARAMRLSTGGFQAVYCPPGNDPQVVLDESGSIRIFQDDRAAEDAALNALFTQLRKSDSGYVAWADQAPDRPGFVAHWRAPGLNSSLLRDVKSGAALVFRTGTEAKTAAIRNLVEVLNRPRRMAANDGKPERYTKLKGPEFARKLQEAGVSPTFFAFLFGTSQKRVLEWIDGVDFAPHPARVMLELFARNPANIDIAEEVTEASTEARSARKERT